jgi:hypothetical protein
MAISVAPLTAVVMNFAGSDFSGAASEINDAAWSLAALPAVALHQRR